MEMVYRMDIYYIPSGFCQTPHHLLFVYTQSFILKFFPNFYRKTSNKQSFHPNLAFFQPFLIREKGSGERRKDVEEDNEERP